MSKQHTRPRPSSKRAITTYEEIRNTIRSLHDAEKDPKTSQHLRASTEPRFNETQEELENLDALARLLSGDEVCSGVCYNNNILFVASNRESPLYAKTYLTFLQHYINSPFKKNYQRLEEEADNQIIRIISNFQNSNRSLFSFNRAQYHKDKSYTDLDDVINKKDLKLIKEQAEKIIKNNSSSVQARELAVDLLRPIIDTRIITNALETRKGLAKEVILAIKNTYITYLNSSNQKHAEMKIFDQINAIGGAHDIGISKLACWPCSAALYMFNKHCQETHFRFSGTHGGTYPGWEAPNWIINDHTIKSEFLAFLTKESAQYFKIKETPSYTKYFIPSTPILANFENKEAAQIYRKNSNLSIVEQEKPLIEAKARLEELKTQKSELSKLIKANEKDFSKIQIKKDTNDLKELQSSSKQAELDLKKATDVLGKLKVINNKNLTDDRKLSELKDCINEENKSLLPKIREELKKLSPVEKIELLMNACEQEYDTATKLAKIEELRIDIDNLQTKIKKDTARKTELDTIKARLSKEDNDFEKKIEERETKILSLERTINDLQHKQNLLDASLRELINVSADGLPIPESHCYEDTVTENQDHQISPIGEQVPMNE